MQTSQLLVGLATVLLLAPPLLPVRAQPGQGDADEGAPGFGDGGALSEGEEYEDIVRIGSLTSKQLKSIHKELDQDSDGKVSGQELRDYTQAMAEKLAIEEDGAALQFKDMDRDGTLDLGEYLADVLSSLALNNEEDMLELERRQQQETERYTAADLDLNGRIDKHEVAALLYPRAKRGAFGVDVADALQEKDTDGDGRLSSKEFFGVQSEGEVKAEDQQAFAKLDADGNGSIDENELYQYETGGFQMHQAMGSLFELADQDKDLHVTSDELLLAHPYLVGIDADHHLSRWTSYLDL